MKDKNFIVMMSSSRNIQSSHEVFPLRAVAAISKNNAVYMKLLTMTFLPFELRDVLSITFSYSYGKFLFLRK